MPMHEDANPLGRGYEWTPWEQIEKQNKAMKDLEKVLKDLKLKKARTTVSTVSTESGHKQNPGQKKQQTTDPHNRRSGRAKSLEEKPAGRANGFHGCLFDGRGVQG